MLSKDSPEANILLRRHVIYKQQRGTERVDTTGEHWMEPFGLALGLNSMEFAVWRDLFFTKSDQILLVEGPTDKEYLELLRDNNHGKNRLIFEGEIYPYGGIGNLQNGVLLNFLKNKYKRILVTYDLDAQPAIESVLKGLGFEKGKTYLPIGLNEGGRKAIEGLVPEDVKHGVYGANGGLVEQAMNGDQKEKASAKAQLKSLTLAAFKEGARPGNDYYKHFYELSKAINKALSV